jgi:formylglycine-generating enzyme required for sulfatase activity/tRNA A-37 threonylcarbamoyl transferase component Bud32
VTDLNDLRALLHELKQRLVRGEIDELTYERRREMVLEDLSPEERAALTPSSRAVSRKSAPAPSAQMAVPLGLQGSLVPREAQVRLEPGAVVMDQWRLVREIGRGGFGAVFEAEDLRLNQRLALKVLDPSLVGREEMLARFRREVSLARSLSHPRIVRVYDYREALEDELALLTMELVEGGSVREVNLLARKQGQRISLRLAQAVLSQTLEALETAHAAGVIHRDVTPGNVLLAGGSAEALLASPESDPKVKLVDFGIAGLLSRSELSEKSRVLGTAAYVAPEVLSADAHVGPEADLYGVGAVVYEMLTGFMPIGRFPAVQEVRGEVSAGLNDLVLALLDVRPGARPHPREALEVLARLAGGGTVEKKRQARSAREEVRGTEGLPPENPSPLDTWVNPKDGLTYVWIPPGSFQMGAVPGDSKADRDEKPRHPVTISKGFWLCRTEVTVGAYEKFCAATGRAMPPPPHFNPNWQYKDHPIVEVNWDDAVAYCRWAGGRLPTEAEWEYAARAGTETVYWWGNSYRQGMANCNEKEGRVPGGVSLFKTTPVGHYPANAWGLYDMLGNVQEWCADWYEKKYYASSPATDPKGPEGVFSKVLRGGSWYDSPRGLRVSNRGEMFSSFRDYYTGFRCVRDE